MVELPEPNYEHLNSPEWRDHADRMLAWFNNPDRAKVRRTAKNVIAKRVAEVVELLVHHPGADIDAIVRREVSARAVTERIPVVDVDAVQIVLVFHL